jgi:hypothetical protein
MAGVTFIGDAALGLLLRLASAVTPGWCRRLGVPVKVQKLLFSFEVSFTTLFYDNFSLIGYALLFAIGNHLSVEAISLIPSVLHYVSSPPTNFFQCVQGTN